MSASDHKVVCSLSACPTPGMPYFLPSLDAGADPLIGRYNLETHILEELEDRLAVCRLPAGSQIPGWVRDSAFMVYFRTPEEVSIVCAQDVVPDGVQSEKGWCAMRVHGVLDFSLVGVLAALLIPLRDAGVSVFVLSSYDTDYILVREDRLADAQAALRAAGHSIQ